MSVHRGLVTLPDLEQHPSDVLDEVAHDKPLFVTNRTRLLSGMFAADDVAQALAAGQARHAEGSYRSLLQPHLLITEEQFASSPLGYMQRLIEGGCYLLIVARDESDDLLPFVALHAVRSGAEPAIFEQHRELFGLAHVPNEDSFDAHGVQLARLIAQIISR